MQGILFTADMHIRETTPECRTDDFIKAQWDKLYQVAQIVKKENLYWIDAGDLFHAPRPNLKLISEFIGRMNEWGAHIDGMVLGNHDLPSHNMGRVFESGTGVVLASGVVRRVLNSDGWDFPVANSKDVVIYGSSYTEHNPPQPTTSEINYVNMLVMHHMVYKNRAEMIPNAPGSFAKNIIREGTGYKFIISGHNHQHFTVKLGHRTLVNVGSLTRQAADQKDHIPMIAVWTPRDGMYTASLDYDSDVVSRAHLDKQQKKEDEINSFVETLQNVDSVSLSFESNVDRVMEEMKPEKPVKEKVREAME
jgi:DNA repair exonuclease SbcCD nuclease subunit